MRWRALLVIATCTAGVLGVALLFPLGPTATPTPSLVVDRSQDGDLVMAKVLAYNGTSLVYDPKVAQTYTAGEPGDAALPGLAPALLNVSAGETVNVTLAPWEAFGNRSWDKVVNVSRVNTVSRSAQVPERALDRFLGRVANVGDNVTLPEWPAEVTDLSGGVATLYATPRVGDRVHRLPYWDSTVTAMTADNMTLRDDPVVGTPVETPADQSGNAPAHGNVTGVNDTTLQVDFNPPFAGEQLRVVATVVAIKPGSNTLGFVAKLEADQASCESHHAGFVSFQATSDVTPNANGTAWVNVTLGDPWHHAFTQGQVVVGNDTQPIPTLGPGESQTLSFLEPSGYQLPIAIRGDAHFAHGGGAPDDSLYSAQGLVNTAVRHQAAPVALSGARIDTGATSVTWGRFLGWAAMPLALYPAWEGWRARQARLQGRPRAYRWPVWLDLHTFPALAATLVSFAHGAVLMLDAYRGNQSEGVWSGVIALLLLSGLGGSGLVLARWVPARWKEARGWHAGISVAVLLLGVIHALLIGTTFKFLRR